MYGYDDEHLSRIPMTILFIIALIITSIQKKKKGCGSSKRTTLSWMTVTATAVVTAVVTAVRVAPSICLFT
jgi:hypothetical protein